MIKKLLSPVELARQLKLKSTRKLFVTYMVGVDLTVYMAKNGAIIGKIEIEDNPTAIIRQIDNSLSFLDATDLSEYCYRIITQ